MKQLHWFKVRSPARNELAKCEPALGTPIPRDWSQNWVPSSSMHILNDHIWIFVWFFWLIKSQGFFFKFCVVLGYFTLSCTMLSLLWRAFRIPAAFAAGMQKAVQSKDCMVHERVKKTYSALFSTNLKQPGKSLPNSDNSDDKELCGGGFVISSLIWRNQSIASSLK